MGMFAGGLSSFVTTDEAGTPEDDESATAGMELTVMGVQVRPFVFFEGQGELMGHVWSGTGSERTPAFQVNFSALYFLFFVRNYFFASLGVDHDARPLGAHSFAKRIRCRPVDGWRTLL